MTVADVNELRMHGYTSSYMYMCWSHCDGFSFTLAVLCLYPDVKRLCLTALHAEVLLLLLLFSI